MLSSATPTASGTENRQFVYVRSPPLLLSLSPIYRSPYRVRAPGSKYFVIDIDGTLKAVWVDNIKPHLGPYPLTAAPGPGRGRPPWRQ